MKAWGGLLSNKMEKGQNLVLLVGFIARLRLGGRGVMGGSGNWMNRSKGRSRGSSGGEDPSRGVITRVRAISSSSMMIRNSRRGLEPNRSE